MQCLSLSKAKLMSYNEFFFQVDKRYNPLFIDLVFDLGIEAVEEKDNGVYVRSYENLDELAFAFEIFKERLNKQQNTQISLHTSLQKKPNKDWIDEYKKSVQPLKIGKFYIHSSWQKPHLNAINVQIDPALAFGSGHHESTNSCIRLLEKYAKKGKKALDVGCGSGILSIILAKLGCKVDSCDTDELATQSTLSNAKLNQIEIHHIWQGSVDKTNELYDVVVANLVGDIILMLEKDLKASVTKGGFLIVAGILDKYKDRINHTFKDFKEIEQIKTNEWLSFVYQKEK